MKTGFTGNLSIRQSFYIGPSGLLLVLLFLTVIFYSIGNANNRIWQQVSNQYFSVLHDTDSTILTLNDLHQTLLSSILIGDKRLSEEQIYSQGLDVIDKMSQAHQQLTVLLNEARGFVLEPEVGSVSRLIASSEKAFEDYEIVVRSSIEMSSVDLGLVPKFTLSAVNGHQKISVVLNELQSALYQNIRSTTEQRLAKYNSLYDYLWWTMLLFTAALFFVSYSVSKHTADLLEYIHGGLVETANSVKNKGVAFKEQKRALSVSDVESTVDVFSKVVIDLEHERHRTEVANEAKSKFLSSMSHELRTPLNAILGFAQLLKKGGDLNESQQEDVGYIMSSGEYLLALVNQVLDLSVIEEDSIQLTQQAVDLDKVINEVQTAVSPIAIEAGVELYCEIGQSGSVLADETKLKQVLLNLLSNAIKYNKQHGSVKTDYQYTDDQHIKIMVTDTGLGIAKENIDKVFNAFERLGYEGSPIEGTGIGLMVSKGLVEKMAGKIGFESQEGTGSTFWIKLPVSSRD